MSESAEDKAGQPESSGSGAPPEQGGGYQGEFFTEAPPPPPVQKRVRRGSKPSPLIFVGFALLAAVMLTLVLLHHSGGAPSSDSQDLGDGVYKAAGLRGHMLARWDGKLHYQVQIEPLDPTYASSFNFTLNNLPRPVDITLRLLDSSGFALCQKTVLIPYDPARSLAAVVANARRPAGRAAAARFDREQAARQAQVAQMQAQEQARVNGQDVFHDQVDSDGNIIALNAEGDFPCDRKSFKHVDYWDMTTNFPTLDEQQALMHQKESAARLAAEARRAAKMRNARRFTSAFYVQGDEHVSGYDASRSLLTTGPGRSFYIVRPSDRAIAAAWAANLALIHYKCDQQAACALTHSGTPGVIYGKLNQ